MGFFGLKNGIPMVYYYYNLCQKIGSCDRQRLPVTKITCESFEQISMNFLGNNNNDQITIRSLTFGFFKALKAKGF